jgi:hypothetical protein
MLNRNCKLFAIVFALLANGSIAYANGALPTLIEKTRFKSHADCVASLRNDLQQARDSTTNGPIGFRDGMTRQVTLLTDGLVTQSRNVTSYQSELWRSFGAPIDRPAVPETDETSGKVKASQIPTAAKYEKRLSVCKGRTKTVAREDGYSMDRFE